MINYKTGINMFDVLPTDKSVMIPHVCNNVYAFGAGFALATARKYPAAKTAYLDQEKLELGETQFVEVSDPAESKIIIANMVAQHRLGSINGVPPIRYDALRKCMEQVKEYIEKSGITFEVHAPKFGAGLAQGDWSKIEPLIEELWGNFDVTVYSL